MNTDHATNIAISGLQHLAGDTELLSRFVSLTGMTPDDMRSAGTSSEFLGAILDFYLGDESTLLAFTASANINPADIQKARFALVPPNEGEGW
jgi:hypothetical protein